MGNKSTLAAALAMLAWCNAASASTISFSGYQWNVHSGSNIGSGQNVHVDASGNLHLALTYDNGQWNAAELASAQSFGFGAYQFQLQGQPAPLDPNVVFGLFDYGPAVGVGVNGTNEIDIEFASFDPTGATPSHGNWTVWPAVAGTPGSPATQQFSTGPTDQANTQRFTRSGTQITFQALTGFTDSNSGEYANWTYAPSDYLQRIPQQPMPVYMTLRLLDDGKGGILPPSNGQSVEVVVSSFKFTPLSPVPEPGPAPLMAAGIGIVWMASRGRRNTALPGVDAYRSGQLKFEQSPSPALPRTPPPLAGEGLGERGC